MLDFQSHALFAQPEADPVQLEKPERRFCVHLANEMDLFISAKLIGDEPDFIEQMKARLSERHNGALDHVEIVRIILVG
jgi:hypothetical protein